MRPRRVRPGADVRLEREAVAPELVQEDVHPPRELALGPADEPLLGDPCKRLVRDLRCPTDRVQLGLVLHGAQALDEAAPRHELEAPVGQHAVARVRERLRLEGDPAAQSCREVGIERAARLRELDAVDGTAGICIAEVGEQAQPLGLDEERRVRALEAGQVAEVRRVADEQRLVERGAQALDAVAHRAARNSRASR
jgi:hypothetical protein